MLENLKEARVMVNIEVDLDACVGCGTCESLCPSTFQLQDGKSYVIGDGSDCDLEEVVNSCPTGAITVEGIGSAERKQV
ncbi:ferredoxin [Candidatus Pyrohabitans sp.]